MWNLLRHGTVVILWERRKTCGISLIYLAFRHYSINFTAEYAAFDATHCRT